jgi:hypothetical protein
MFEINKGNNHPKAKYNIWNIDYIGYNKYKMFRNNRKPNPCKCFKLKYKGYELPIGGFIDFISIEIINKIVSNELN